MPPLIFKSMIHSTVGLLYHAWRSNTRFSLGFSLSFFSSFLLTVSPVVLPLFSQSFFPLCSDLRISLAKLILFCTLLSSFLVQFILMFLVVLKRSLPAFFNMCGAVLAGPLPMLFSVFSIILAVPSSPRDWEFRAFDDLLLL